jgi:hypothetical protein
MVILQTLSNAITSEGALSGDYALGLAFGVIGFLLVAVATLVGNYFISTLKGIKTEIQNIHTRIDTRKSEHDELAKLHEQTNTQVLLIKSRMDTDGEKLAMNIALKLRAMSTRPPGFYDNETEE